MERLLTRVPLLLVEWLNPVGSGATCIVSQIIITKNPPKGVDCVQRWLFTSVVEFQTGTIFTAGRFRYAVDCVLPLVT